MSIQIALHHQTRYGYDRPVRLSPHEIRLRPAPHCRTRILSYSLNLAPEQHHLNWQQDPYGNYIARCVFPEKTRELEITVDLVADMTAINPFDFFVEPQAMQYPFRYNDALYAGLAPYLAIHEQGPLLTEWVAACRARHAAGTGTVAFLSAINAEISNNIKYLTRMQPGVQTCDDTLRIGSGSCRDSGWLLVQALRHCGLAARFVSGYLIQLAPDVKPLEGPAGPENDNTDLHAWAEAYVPGAGWLGLDATSGLFAAEGHIPLACTPLPPAAAPVSGTSEPCTTGFDHSMSLTRIHENPRVTRPYTEVQWQAIDALGHKVDAELAAGDVRLTQGGEPTFVCSDKPDDPEWNTAALSANKWQLAEALARRLKQRFATEGLLMHGQGKWYPGESQPRWALNLYWRTDGQPLWRNPDLIAAEGTPAQATPAQALQLAQAVAAELGFNAALLIAAHEDPLLAMQAEARLPANIDLQAAALRDAGERAKFLQTLTAGHDSPAGYVLPLRSRRTPQSSGEAVQWESSRWPLRRERLYAMSGAAPLGARLPIDSLPELLPGEFDPQFERDPFAPHDAAGETTGKSDPAPREVVRTALCVEARDGRLYVFLPPLEYAADFIRLIEAVERGAQQSGVKLRIEGYAPPTDTRLRVLSVTPDPGVIEVNVHPAASWPELCSNTFAIQEEARQLHLVAEKFMHDGRHIGTGGGNHVTLGGPAPADSPLLRRPDLLRSLITYWQNHPALSYLFSGRFIGPTSQAPRVDEARDDQLYELEIAFQQLSIKHSPGEESPAPWLIDRLLRNLLVDVTGNIHRTEFCIDKLYSPASPGGRQGLVELRAFEMPPHPQMNLVQSLLLRALVVRFWKTPYAGRLIRWGSQLHDRFMLPHFIAADMLDVVRELQAAGYGFDYSWLAPFIEFRFPHYGSVVYDGIGLELRQALEPWHVLGEDVETRGTSRTVDSSVQRLQARITGMTQSRHVIACNGAMLPLHPTGVPGEFVAGVRFRAWTAPEGLHPTIRTHAPLTFDIVDTWSGRSIGGCTYHVAHPGGLAYETRPVNASEAEARRVARFWDHGHTPGPMSVKPGPLNPNFPLTLDLRWSPR